MPSRPQDESTVMLRRVDLFGGVELLYASHRAHAYPRHTHDEYVIAAMTRGVEALHHLRGVEHVPAGSVILLNPCEVHFNHSVDENGFAYRTIYVPPNSLGRILPNRFGTESPGFRRPVISDSRVYRMVLRFHKAVDRDEPRLMQESLFAELMTILFGRYGNAGPSLPRREGRGSKLQEVRAYIDAHAAECVSLSAVSSLCGLSPFQLVNAFRNAFGLPPHQYQLNRRIARAKALLRNGMAISEVAVETGFSDQSHFTRHFKKFLGLTPGQFLGTRKNVQDKL